MEHPSNPEALVRAWRALGGQLAAAAGAAVALISLVSKTPVSVASMRGAVAFGLAILLTRIGAGIALRTYQAPPPEPIADSDAETAAPENSSKALPS